MLFEVLKLKEDPGMNCAVNFHAPDNDVLIPECVPPCRPPHNPPNSPSGNRYL